MISEIIKISSWFNITGFLVTMDIKRGHLLSTYAKPMIRTRGVRNVSFSGKFAYVRNGWPKKAFDSLDHIVFLFPS